MNLTLVSHFRNSAHYIDRYFDQVGSLNRLLKKTGHSLSLVLGYGDSTDYTEAYLHENTQFLYDTHCIDVSHGGRNYGSIVHPQRFKQLAGIGNLLWSNIPRYSDFVCLVESDLIWQADTIMSLLNAQEGLQKVSSNHSSRVILAPMILHQDGRFYDTWAFRRRGLNFKNEAPYHPDLPGSDQYLEMDSVGSVMLMEYALAKQLSWPEEDVVVGFCRMAKETGCRIWLDKIARVYHP